MVDTIDWLGHSSIRIRGEKVVYIDPWKLGKTGKADVVLISHPHSDHCSPGDVKKILKDETVILATADCAPGLPDDIRAVQPGDEVSLGAIHVTAVPAYNVNKAFHPKAKGWVGFVITVGGKNIYYAGDTDLIPEMKGLKADIMIVPVGGTYTMTAEEAADAVNIVNPEIAVPVHFGDIVGSLDDAKRFRKLCRCKVMIKSASPA
jgi:L-ascorbate metabolism protein UlaG (beta-lactamase superfamily)